jgi:hypothetical protein
MCVLRARGSDFDVDRFLSASTIQPCKVYRKGEPRLLASRQPEKRVHAASGFHADVSTMDWDDLAGQVADARRFLARYKPDLELLRTFPGVEHLELDFPTHLRIGTNDVAVQSDRFPSDLLLAAGTLGIGLALTIWPRPTPNSASEGTG